MVGKKLGLRIGKAKFKPKGKGLKLLKKSIKKGIVFKRRKGGKK